MGRKKNAPHHPTTKAFLLEGQKQFVAVVDSGQTLRRCRWGTQEVLDEVVCPITSAGCTITEMAVSPSGSWLVTARSSGQGEWGYDVLRTCPLTHEAGISQEHGYTLELPRFAADESFLVGGAGPGFLGGWWAHPDDEIDEPSRGGTVSVGFLFVHRLSRHRVSRHKLCVKLPVGGLPDDPWKGWDGPHKIRPRAAGVRMQPSWSTSVDFAFPLPRVLWLPTPHPSGQGLV